MQQTMRRSTRQTRELTRQLGKLTEAQAALGWLVILILVALLGAIYLNQTSEIAAAGRRVQILQDELEVTKRVNGEIERDIAEAESLDRLQAAAAALGFTPAGPDDIEYLVVPDYPAEEASPPLRTEPTPTAEPAPAAESMRDALTLAVENGFERLFRGESGE